MPAARSSLLAVLVAALLAAPLPREARADEAKGGFLDSLGSIFDPRSSPFIPIPEIGTDPNSGTTWGLLPVFLSTDPNGSVSRIIAPDATWNSDLGWGGHFRLFSYPSIDTQWHAVAGFRENSERELDLTWVTGITRQRQLSWGTSLVYDRSATERFFGFGNRSPRGDQTNYTAERAYLDVSLGWNLTPALQLGWVVRPGSFRAEHGVLSGLPSIETRFPNLPGSGGQHTLEQRLQLSWDTRDSTALPRRGSNVVVYAGNATRDLLSSVSYSFVGAEARNFAPLGPGLVLASHAALRYMPGNTAPFWAQSSLGGDRAVLAGPMLLRGYGADRFIDRNAFSASLELRADVLNLDLFTTNVTLELAPFVDAGRVFRKAGDNPLRSLHVVEGLGVRARASPYILGYVDIGHGAEGVAIFSGIDYAF